MRAVHHPRRRYEIPWAAIGQSRGSPREKRSSETIADGREAGMARKREEEEEVEDGRSFRIYRRSRSNRTARGHAAAECSLQPALRMWTRLDESAIAPSQRDELALLWSFLPLSPCTSVSISSWKTAQLARRGRLSSDTLIAEKSDRLAILRKVRCRATFGKLRGSDRIGRI